MGEGGAQPFGRDRHHCLRLVAAGLDDDRAGGELAATAATIASGLAERGQPGAALALSWLSKLFMRATESSTVWSMSRWKSGSSI